MKADKPQVFWLRPRDPLPHDPRELFQTAAQRQHRQPSDLYEEVKLTDEELARRVL